MLSWIKDVPETLIGLVVALACWFAFNYVVLAPRAMGDQFEKSFYPACAANLRTTQEALLEKAKVQADVTRQRLRAELRNTTMQLETTGRLDNMYSQSGLSQFLNHYGGMDLAGGYASAQQALRDRLEQARNALDRLPDFDTLRQSDAALLKTCACAGLQVMSGARMDYTLHTTSFRLVSPHSLANLKQQIGDLTQTSGCSEFPWEGLSRG
jgi:hypothetical protein